jgi:hypothetical protein
MPTCHAWWVSTASFYSDRTAGRRPRDIEHLPAQTWRGLLALIQNKIDSNWMAKQFPEMCPDGNGVVGTNRVGLSDLLQALVPDLDWPVGQSEQPATSVALDLVDFVAQRIAKPEPKRYHDFFKHHELDFDIGSGRAEFRQEMNLLFARGGVAFELDTEMRMARLGPPEGRQALADLRPDTGDSTLDQLIVEARTRYLSRDARDVRIGLEKLWDAFERLKTIEGGSKKTSVTSCSTRSRPGRCGRHSRTRPAL